MNALISDILDEEILILALLNRRRKRRARRRRHRWWVHPIIRRRKIKGAYRNLVAELLQDEERFNRYFRTTREQFTQILHHIEQDLTKVYKSRETIGPRERLAVALRFLATGESYASLAFQFRLGLSTISRIIPEVCNAIWNRMGPLYMRAPESAEQWKLISANFWQKWQFPFCLGAVDGKHIVMMKPWKSGSLYFNCKGTCSIVLMALVDANLQFIAIDTGSYGRNSDGGIFSRCPLGKRFAQGTFNFPLADHFPGFEHIGEVPYVAVGDEAFPLMPNLLRPFPGKEKAWDKEVFNYRLSRARRIVENAFGILAARWRVFHTKMAVSPKNANAVVKAACVLHNMLQRSSTPAMITTLLHDAPDLSNAEGLRDIQHVGYRGGNDAVAVRNRYKQFFNEDESCPWQYQHVRRGYTD